MNDLSSDRLSDRLSDQDSEFSSLVPRTPVSRRDFVAGALGAGFALAVQPVCANTAISTGADGLATGMVRIPAGDIDMPAYRAMPASGSNFPVVLVVHEIFGVHEYIRDVCRRLAKLGYMAVAPDLYARQGEVSKIAGVQEILNTVVARVPDAQVMRDLDACAEWAGSNGGDAGRLAVTGFCWGGRIAWLYAAHQPRLGAGVAWYGRLVGQAGENTPLHPLDVAGRLHAPVLGLYGELDQGIPLETVEKMEAALKAGGDRSRIRVYDDAPHAFHADYRPSYRKEAAEDGWKRMAEWLRRHGV